MTRALFWGVVATCGLAARGAIAEEPSAKQIAAAREQFRKGVSLEVAQDYAGALAVFKEVALVKSTPQVRFHIAVCEEKLGDLVSALGSYKLAQIEAQAAGATDVASASAEAVDALGPRIPKLTLKRGAGAAAAALLLDGREVTGQPTDLPINPGAHAIRATAEGRRPFEQDVTLEAGESQEIEVVLAPEERAAPIATATAAPIARPAPTAPPTSGSALKISGFVIGGAGLSGLAAAGVLLGLRGAAMDELDARCGPDRRSCPDSLRSTRDAGVLYSTASTAAWIAGGSAVALGGALILFAPKGAAPSVAVTPGGISVTGRF